jgi:hypothetical protein
VVLTAGKLPVGYSVAGVVIWNLTPRTPVDCEISIVKDIPASAL